ncbi:hypothetical protein [Secundilactobacillus kimchicus]|nr:hypothetical protein [Secundilactobacillus kimchicus]
MNNATMGKGPYGNGLLAHLLTILGFKYDFSTGALIEPMHIAPLDKD